MNNNDKNNIYYSCLSYKERKKLREWYIEYQKGICIYCNCPLNDEPAEFVRISKIDWNHFPPNFLKYPIHLHHDHDTDLVIGSIHALCNAHSWEYKGI